MYLCMSMYWCLICSFCSLYKIFFSLGKVCCLEQQATKYSLIIQLPRVSEWRQCMYVCMYVVMCLQVVSIIASIYVVDIASSECCIPKVNARHQPKQYNNIQYYRSKPCTVLTTLHYSSDVLATSVTKFYFM